jgi:hypothetical protein
MRARRHFKEDSGTKNRCVWAACRLVRNSEATLVKLQGLLVKFGGYFFCKKVFHPRGMVLFPSSHYNYNYKLQFFDF